MACCCDSCHAPKSTTCCHGYIKPTKQTKYIYAPPSHMSLPWFPSESAHDARCYAHHCVCSNNSCHQRPLRCNSYRQSGLALSMAFFHVFRSQRLGEGWIPCGVERRPARLGAGSGAKRQCVCVCARVCGRGSKRGRSYHLRDGHKPSQSVGMGDWQGRRLSSKNTPPPGSSKNVL